MDKIEKFLRKLSSKEQEAMMLLLLQLRKDYSKVPGVKKLKGENSFYRVRLGPYRIIFEVRKNHFVLIHKITRRNERTYKGL